MRIFLTATVIFFFLFTVSTAYSSDEERFYQKKDSVLQQIKPKKPVRIKLKRTSNGKYTWDLTGDDVEEIIKIDRKLKKMLKVK